jgi:23S rRNA (guanosine2251-2'-O)-methyltransferase
MVFSGRNSLVEALNSDLHLVEKVYISQGSNIDEKLQKIIDLCDQSQIKPQWVSRKEIEKLSRTEDTQGVAFDLTFTFSKLSQALSTDNFSDDSYIYIYTATYEHNVGAICRSAETAGFKGVIIPKNIDMTNTIARTSVGSIFNIKIFRESIFQSIKEFKDVGKEIFAIERGGKNYFDTDLSNGGLFIIGGEDKSISENIKKRCNHILEIPQKGKVNSLNMSVAASIIMFESLKQKIKQVS